jgi:3-oxoacyl-[acyl-carrier protein] reductase
MESHINDMFRLPGQVAVITGGGSGIGREMARVFAQAGASVVVGDVRLEGLGETVALIEADGGKAIACRTDVARRSEIDTLASRAVDAFGGIGVWVNCAGILQRNMLLDASEEEFDRAIDVNLKGVYWGCIAAARVMKGTGGGSIINISSVGGLMPVPGRGVYCITKAGVNMVTQTAAKEFGPYGIRVNAIAPGTIDTPMTAELFIDARGQIDLAKREEALQQRRDASPLGIAGEPRDIALTGLFLASEASRYMTGQIISPNGGVWMG